MKNNQPGKVKCSPMVPEPPSVTVGLDLPLKELKMKLLKDEKVSMLVLTAAGGCGKPTLAKKFCQDQEVKVVGGFSISPWKLPRHGVAVSWLISKSPTTLNQLLLKSTRSNSEISIELQ